MGCGGVAGGQREVRGEFKIGSLRTESLYLAYVLWPVPMRPLTGSFNSSHRYVEHDQCPGSDHNAS